MPVSAVQQATRAFISAIKPMAGCDGVELHISRDSPDADLCSAYRKVSRRVHPDRSGNGEDPKCLNAAHEAWVEAVSTAKGRGGRHAPRSDGADVWGQRGHGGGVADRAEEDAAGTTFPHPVLWCPAQARGCVKGHESTREAACTSAFVSPGTVCRSTWQPCKLSRARPARGCCQTVPAALCSFCVPGTLRDRALPCGVRAGEMHNGLCAVLCMPWALCTLFLLRWLEVLTVHPCCLGCASARVMH